MAQWLGQFSGNTHRTAVVDAQELMPHAVAAFVNASSAERPRKAKAVRPLAKRLLVVRTRFLEAQLSAASDPPFDDALSQVAKLEEALSALIAGGVTEILKEFGFHDPAHLDREARGLNDARDLLLATAPGDTSGEPTNES